MMYLPYTIIQNLQLRFNSILPLLREHCSDCRLKIHTSYHAMAERACREYCTTSFLGMAKELLVTVLSGGLCNTCALWCRAIKKSPILFTVELMMWFLALLTNCSPCPPVCRGSCCVHSGEIVSTSYSPTHNTDQFGASISL